MESCEAPELVVIVHLMVPPDPTHTCHSTWAALHNFDYVTTAMSSSCHLLPRVLICTGKANVKLLFRGGGSKQQVAGDRAWPLRCALSQKHLVGTHRRTLRLLSPNLSFRSNLSQMTDLRRGVRPVAVQQQEQVPTPSHRGNGMTDRQRGNVGSDALGWLSVIQQQ